MSKAKDSKMGALEVARDEHDEDAELDPRLQESISTVRLRQIAELVLTYHAYYENLSSYGKRDQERIMDRITGVYLPNVLQALPGILGKIGVQARYIKALRLEKAEMERQRNKAYRYLGWVTNDYFDGAQALPDDPTELMKGEYEELVKQAFARPKDTTPRKPKPRAKRRTA